MTANFSQFILIFSLGLLVIYAMYLPNNNLALVGSLKSRNIRSWIYFAETEEKTEEATPHRREEAQKKGQVGKSSDLNSAIIGLAIIGTIYSLTGYIGDNISQYMYYIFSNSSVFTIDQFFSISKLSLYLCLKIMAPIFGVAVIIGLLANFLQVGFIFATETLKPKLEHINPLEGFKRIFSKRALFELAKTLLKVFIIGLVIYNQVKKEYPNILLLIDMDLISMSEYLIKVTFKVSITAAVAFLILAVIDFAYQKWQFGHSLRMSKYEIRKEMKQMEGDPLIKARIREKQRIMGMRRMIQSVPEATVVVTNPTHLAVALKYDEQLMDAPQIVAKGSGYLAEKIKEKAKEFDIPIVEDRPLARSLYKGSEIGDFIPVELYQAVAGIIAAIYALKQK